MSEWVSVEDRLPPGDTCVWCFGTYDGYDAFCFEGYYHERSRRWLAINNGDYRDGGYGSDYDADIAHWMPLPKPPKDGK